MLHNLYGWFNNLRKITYKVAATLGIVDDFCNEPTFILNKFIIDEFDNILIKVSNLDLVK